MVPWSFSLFSQSKLADQFSRYEGRGDDHEHRYGTHNRCSFEFTPSSEVEHQKRDGSGIPRGEQNHRTDIARGPDKVQQPDDDEAGKHERQQDSPERGEPGAAADERGLLELVSQVEKVALDQLDAQGYAGNRKGQRQREDRAVNRQDLVDQEIGPE